MLSAGKTKLKHTKKLESQLPKDLRKKPKLHNKKKLSVIIKSNYAGGKFMHFALKKTMQRGCFACLPF